jgi:hypothetical protein
MAYIAASTGCCLCKECWNIADVPHETRGVIFTVRTRSDDGFEYHVLPQGFATKMAAEAALKMKQDQVIKDVTP